MLPLVRRPASHVFEPPDLWQTRLDAAFGDRAQRIRDRHLPASSRAPLGNLCKSQLQLEYNVWRGGLLHWVGG